MFLENLLPLLDPEDGGSRLINWYIPTKLHATPSQKVIILTCIAMRTSEFNGIDMSDFVTDIIII
jgi:hypothetical protein